ncbi:MAG: ABC transporter ATP-binding protein [Pseudomonadota bacterium]
MSTPIVQVNAISKSFGAQQVLQQLDWSIRPGQVIGLLGRNGAGKSTLIECMLGLRETDGGSVALWEQGVGDLSDAVRARIGYAPQKSDMFEWLTPTQLLDYFKALYPRWNTAKVEALLARWGFDAQACDKQISRLSGGEKQRLSIIRALAHDPQLLILDEPVSALDPIGRRDFLRELVETVIERDTTVVFSTHILSDLERVAFDLAFLKGGKIALAGAMDELLERARRVSGPGALLDACALDGELARRRSGQEVSVITQGDSAQLDALAAREPALRVEPVSLEDLFIAVTE